MKTNLNKASTRLLSGGQLFVSLLTRSMSPPMCIIEIDLLSSRSAPSELR